MRPRSTCRGRNTNNCCNCNCITFITHITLHSAEKNPHRIFRKLPLNNFAHSAIRIIPLPFSMTLSIWNFVFSKIYTTSVWFESPTCGRCVVMQYLFVINIIETDAHFALGILTATNKHIAVPDVYMTTFRLRRLTTTNDTYRTQNRRIWLIFISSRKIQTINTHYYTNNNIKTGNKHQLHFQNNGLPIPNAERATSYLQ